MTIRVSPGVVDDIVAGFHFYESQDAGVGRRFVDTTQSAIDSLATHAGIHSIVRSDIHRMLVPRFPFAVYYRLVDDTVLVIAVLDCRRDPSWIRQKLSR